MIVTIVVIFILRSGKHFQKLKPLNKLAFWKKIPNLFLTDTRWTCSTIPGQNDLRLEFGQIKRFSWRELQIATNNFSEQNVLGKGGFGKVYKGVLPGPDSIKIAVKRLFDVESPEGDLPFLREVELISIAVHKNILRLIGFCTTPKERLLVYPFMENLSVASRLRGTTQLSWDHLFLIMSLFVSLWLCLFDRSSLRIVTWRMQLCL